MLVASRHCVLHVRVVLTAFLHGEGEMVKSTNVSDESDGWIPI